MLLRLAQLPTLFRGSEPLNCGSRFLKRLYNFEAYKFNKNTVKEIEAEWKKDGRLKKALELSRKSSSKNEKPFYVLSMFPYPSGKLHMGHVKVYASSDAIAHYHRMQGKQVIHPMGWDAFGLPAENAAIEKGVKPKEWTESNIAAMREQLSCLDCTFDWDREVSTCDPAYYRWTQHFFLKLLERGLAYQRRAMVNWDPVDLTVLADEQVDQQGRSWRSGAKVEKRPLKQWFFKTTAFSKDLYEGLDDPTLFSWSHITGLQRGWIGECTGIQLDLKLTDPSEGEVLTAWTDIPEELHKVSYVAVGEEHLLNRDELVSKRIHSKMLNHDVSVLSIKALHPFEPSVQIPIVVFHSTENLPSPNCDAFIGLGEKDEKVAVELDLDQVSCSKAMSRDEVVEQAKKLSIGGHMTSAGLKDWLVSRQRYWGTPIPVIHCDACGPVPVPESELPVELPDLEKLSSKGMSPLNEAHDWVNTKCPKCGGAAKRETDTMDTFVDSSWYFLRYLDPQNDREPAAMEKAESLPVDIYIGGEEHAILHLYYARFMTHFLHSIGISPVKEPFSRLLVMGMVKAKTYKVESTGQYLTTDQVDIQEGKEDSNKATERLTGQNVLVEWDKMSKSKHNGVDPRLVVSEYGSDTVKMMMLLSGVGPTNWSDQLVYRVRKLQTRLLRLVSLAVTLEKQELALLDGPKLDRLRSELWKKRNHYLKGINFSYSFTQDLGNVLERIEGLVNDMLKIPDQAKQNLPEYHSCLATSIITLAPIAPHLSAELWRGFSTLERKICAQEYRWDEPIFCQPWPQLDRDYNVKLSVCLRWISNKPVVDINVPLTELPDLTLENALCLANQKENVRNLLQEVPHTCDLTTYPEYGATLSFEIDRAKLSIMSESDRERILDDCKRKKDEIWAGGKFKKRRKN